MQLLVTQHSGEQIEINAEVVIGADGAHSTIAREMRLSAPPQRSGRRFAVGGHYRGMHGLDGHVEMFVDGRAYFAINPLSEGRANVMLVVPEEDLRGGRSDVDAFVRERVAGLTGGRVGFQRACLDGKRIAIGPLSYHARRYCGPGVLLAGDAAHFLDPFTGQGVHLALRSAEFAARAVSARIAKFSTEHIAWRQYERALRREIARRQRLAALVALLVRSRAVSQVAAALIHAYPRLFAPVLDAVTGAT
jgi:flavin-dependent dehydrogenase